MDLDALLGCITSTSCLVTQTTSGLIVGMLLFLVAATSFPKTESEYEYYGGINGSPIELFKSDVTGLPLPARDRTPREIAPLANRTGVR